MKMLFGVSFFSFLLTTSAFAAGTGEFAFLIADDGTVSELSTVPPPPPPPPPMQGTPTYDGLNFLGNTVDELNNSFQAKHILVGRAHDTCRFFNKNSARYVRAKKVDCPNGCDMLTIDNGAAVVGEESNVNGFQPTFIFDLRCN